MNIYGTTNILQKALEGNWARHKAITNNIANVDTPNYKRKDVAFDQYLQEAIRRNDGSLANVRPMTYTDYRQFSYREDGNNVDMDLEMGFLAQNQIRHEVLISQVNYNFKRMEDVLRG